MGARLALAVCGAVSPHLLTAAPPAGLALAAMLAGLLFAIPKATRSAMFLLLPMALTLHVLDSRLQDRLLPELQDARLPVVGEIAGLPVRRGDLLEFEFRPLEDHQPVPLPDRIRVRWYTDAPEVQAGETWRLHLRLRPPLSRVNFSGPDPERYFFAEGIGALASVAGDANSRLSQGRGTGLQASRQALKAGISTALEEHPGKGLVLALAIADRSALTRQDRRSMSVTGTGHLLAISGLHIGLGATLGFWAGRLLTGILPVGWRLRSGLLPAWSCAMAVAAAYAALAGFGTSTQRALIMLVVLSVARLNRRSIHSARPYAIAMLFVLLLDPLAPLRAGFWLSFGAVAVLLYVFAPRNRRQGRVASLLFAQAAITLAMLPLSMYWFQQGTVLGLAANLAAIPWVGMVVVPLVLTGAALMLAGSPWAPSVLGIAAEACQWLSVALTWFGGFSQAGFRVTAQPGAASTALAMLGVCICLLPRGMRIRWLAPFLLLPLLLPPARDPDPGQATLELLDVGQGLAALVTTHRHALLYDSGPGQPGEWDMVDSALVPAVAANGRSEVDRIVISHGDLDHAGGAQMLKKRFPRAGMAANLGQGRINCDSTLGWEWDGVSFTVLHPDPGLPYLGNASSCVLGIHWNRGGILLTGDIDSAVEARLAARETGHYAVLLAPHHGSKTSSSQALIEEVEPDIVLFSAAAGNRFGFPAREVLERYLNAGANVLSTSGCGAISIGFSGAGGLEVKTARRARDAIWRWPPEPGCP